MTLHGGWVVVADRAGTLADAYRGIDRLPWPLPLTNTEREYLGVGQGLATGRHELSTNQDATELYSDLCRLSFPTVQLYWANTPKAGVPWAPDRELEPLGFDLVYLPDLISFLGEMQASMPTWNQYVNEHLLFPSLDKAEQYLGMRQRLALLGAPVDEHVLYTPVQLFHVVR